MPPIRPFFLSNIWRRLIWLFWLTLLYGCNEPTPFSAQDYTVRLARVLKESVPVLVSREDIEFPRRRDLQVSFQSRSIDLLEFLTLKDCELQKVVAERNSSLGRLALPSQHLVSELRFLKTGATCLSILKNETFADELTAVLLGKQEELAGRIWQATLAGPEFRAFWRFRNSAIHLNPDSLQALRLLRADIERWLSGDYQVDSQILEQRLRDISFGGGGALIANWRELLRTLPAATLVLDARIRRKPLCFPKMRPPDAETFYKVIQTGFIVGLQRETAKLNRMTYDLLVEVEAIEELLQPVMTQPYDAWRGNRSELIADGRYAIKAHVKALKPMLQECGFL